jgi:hypothetical protein
MANYFLFILLSIKPVSDLLNGFDQSRGQAEQIDREYQQYKQYYSSDKCIHFVLSFLGIMQLLKHFDTVCPEII